MAIRCLRPRGAARKHAAVGSVVPVAGTLVGAGVGLVVGGVITYGAGASGLTSKLADGFSKGVDGLKSLFS